MIEKPNKDGKPPTIEYQEEEVLVSAQCYSSPTSVCLSLDNQAFPRSLSLVSAGYSLWRSGQTMLQYVQGQFVLKDCCITLPV